MNTLPMIKKTIDLLLQQQSVPLFPLGNVEYVASGFKTSNEPPKDGWQKFPGRVEGQDGHWWLRASFDTPEKEEGSYLTLNVSTGIGGWDALNPQGLLYLNGRMVQGLDVNHTEVYLEPGTHYDMVDYMYASDMADSFPIRHEVRRVYADVEGLFYDLWVPQLSLEVLYENTAEYIKTLSALEQAVRLIDFRQIYSEAYFASIRAAREYMKTEYYEKVCSKEGKPTVVCLGHTHIDVEWQWDRAVTREKMQRSFATAKELMDHYPEYCFMLSQPELYRYLKEEAPEKFEEMKQLVAAKRWEPEGGMYLEADCNVTGGESFARQLLMGTRFFKKEFGADNKVLVLPDVFGYSAALPQILKKSGIDYFLTSKIGWNDTNTMPYDEFYWEGIDGTRIFSYFLTAQEAKKDHSFIRITAYNACTDPRVVQGTWDRFQQKEYNDEVVLLYGFGDGGGGPTRTMLEQLRRTAYGLPGLPVTRTGLLRPFLEEAERKMLEKEKELGRVPLWRGELYLEYHRGTYTTMARNKRGNRKAEFGLQKAEALSGTSLLFGGEYDETGFFENWRKVLHDQFHDILPGSSIEKVYEGTDRDYREIGDFYRSVTENKMKELAGRIATSGGTLVYNALGFPRTGTVTVNGETVELTEPVPAMGWAVVKPEVREGVTLSGLKSENRYYVLTLDETGAIASLFDKQAGREVFSGRANTLTAFEDYPDRHDAWDIMEHYKTKPFALDAPAEITEVHDGARAGFRVLRRYLSSTVEQTFWMYTDSRRIDVENVVDWHEKHEVLKVYFPVAVHTFKATYEIQFGHVERPTHENTSWDQARFEVCAHKWVDLSDNGYGFSLLNDCKYGYAAEGSVLSLTMLKCSDHPNPHADEGRHEFTYALLPHAGSFRENGVIREAYALNQPLEAIAVPAQTGELPEEFSLVSCEEENVMLETLKKAEDSDALILRLYESFDRSGTATLHFGYPFRRAVLCGLMEDEQQELPLAGQTLTLPIKNFEILTVKLEK